MFHSSGSSPDLSCVTYVLNTSLIHLHTTNVQLTIVEMMNMINEGGNLNAPLVLISLKLNTVTTIFSYIYLRVCNMLNVYMTCKRTFKFLWDSDKLLI